MLLSLRRFGMQNIINKVGGGSLNKIKRGIQEVLHDSRNMINLAVNYFIVSTAKVKHGVH